LIRHPEVDFPSGGLFSPPPWPEYVFSMPGLNRVKNKAKAIWSEPKPYLFSNVRSTDEKLFCHNLNILLKAFKQSLFV
jgi:hypothetical protein